MIGFEAVERQIERLAHIGDGYPPYNIERILARKMTPLHRYTGRCRLYRQ